MAEPKTKIKPFLDFINTFMSKGDPIMTRIQSTYLFFKDNMYDIPDFTSETTDKFRRLFEIEIGVFFNFENNVEYDEIWIKSNEEIIEYIVQFFSRFIYYYKSNNIYILISKIDNIQRAVKKEIVKFDNYTTYKASIQKSELFFDSFVFNEKNELKSIRVLTIAEFLTKPINESYIEKTQKTLKTYFQVLSDIKSEIDNIRDRNMKLTKLLKNSKNITYVKHIFGYIKFKYPEMDETVETRETIMNTMFAQICKLKINKYDDQTQDMKESASNILKTLRTMKLTYDFITEVLNIDNIVENLIKKINRIDWDIENISDFLLADQVKYKKIEILIDYVKYMEENCLPFIMGFKYEYGHTTICNEIKRYLTEITEVINFFVFKTLGFQKAVEENKPVDVLDSIREITIQTKDLVVDDCTEAFKKIVSIRETTDAIIKMKKTNNMEKLIRELKVVYKNNDIVVDDIQDMFLLIDEIFQRDPKKSKWYIENWWEIDKLSEEIDEATNKYNVSYVNDYNPDLTNKANFEAIFNGEILKLLKIKFQVNILVNTNKTIYDKLKLVFEPNFLENTKFKHFSFKYPNHWLSYLWWFFNIGIEEEREKLRAPPPPPPETVEVVKEPSPGPPPPAPLPQPDNAALKECESRVLKLQSELEALKNVRQHEIELIEQIKEYEKQMKELRIHSNKCDKEIQTILLTQAAEEPAKTPDAQNNPVGQSGVIIPPPVIAAPEIIRASPPETKPDARIAQLQTEKEECLSIIKKWQEYSQKLNQELEMYRSKYGDMTEIDAKIKELMDELMQKEMELDHERTLCESRIQQMQSNWESKVRKLQEEYQITTSKHDLLIQKLELEKEKISEKQEKSKEKIQELKTRLSKSSIESQTEVAKDNANIQKQTDRQIQDLNTKIRQMEIAHGYAIKRKLREIEDMKLLLDKMKTNDRDSVQSLKERIKKINKENSKLKKTIKYQSNRLSQMSIPSPSSPPSQVTQNSPLFMPITDANVHAQLNPKTIVAILRKYIMDSRNPNVPILQSDYSLVKNKLLDPLPPTPYRLIQILNDHHYGHELNTLLYVAINIRIEKNKLRYVKYISSQSNIDPSVQYEYGHTILDIIVRHPEYDYNMKCVSWIAGQPRFNVNSQYESFLVNGVVSITAMTFTTPLIQTVIHNRMRNMAFFINHPKCDLYLRDSVGKTAIDYVLEKSMSMNREKHAMFEQFIKANQRQNQTHRYFFSDYRNIENLDQKLKDVFYKWDKPRFTYLYEEYYKNDKERLQKFENYKNTLTGG